MSTHDKNALMVELNARVRLISNPSIFGFVRKMLDLAPQAFYERPASTRHHSLDERGGGGNLLHTIRVVDLVVIMADACDEEKHKVDILIASAILHDMFRHGIDGEYELSYKNHPLLVQEVAERNNLSCDHYDSIMATVERHMGRWGPRPSTPHLAMSDILHLADTIDARWLENLQH